MKKKRKIKAGLFSLLVLTVPIIGEAQTLDLGTGTFQDFKISGILP